MSARGCSKWQALLAVVLAAASFSAAGCARRDATAERKAPQPDRGPAISAAITPARYVGSEACKTCHAQAFEAWRGSQHRRAMQHAGEGAVLGNFAGARLRHAGVVTKFTRQNGKYFVTTDGPDGKL
ncbi:MAG TPA: multiheme c-type cytochrome, partial [Polyangiaceae bacterium]|nr:multiheme c-type cytochrome [Polyangiaceae bacterium]